MRSQVAQAQSSKIPLTMRCPGPDKVKEQEAMTGSRSGKEKHDAEHQRCRQGSLPFRLDSCRPAAVLAAASCWLGCPYQLRRHFDFGTWVLTWLFLPFFSLFLERFLNVPRTFFFAVCRCDRVLLAPCCSLRSSLFERENDSCENSQPFNTLGFTSLL